MLHMQQGQSSEITGLKNEKNYKDLTIVFIVLNVIRKARTRIFFTQHFCHSRPKSNSQRASPVTFLKCVYSAVEEK